jgi:hypothetical protein
MKRIVKTLSLLAGVGLACVAASAQITTNVLSLTTFDSAAGSPWSYGYFYGNNGLGTQTVDRGYYFPEDVDMTNAVYRYSFDITDLAGTTAWGTGTGAPLFRADTDPALFVSGDRADYILTFDAKAVGLAAGQTAANGEMQFQFYRKDENGQDVNFTQVNIPFQPTAEWKTFRFALDEGSLGAGTLDADFAAHHAEVSDIRFNINFHEPFNAYGYDADNEFLLDNVKLEAISRPVVTTPTPTYTKTILDWNMDDKPVWYQYQYDWSANDNHATFAGANAAGSNTEGVNGSTAWSLAMDSTSLGGNTPSYAGGGSGGGGPVDYTLFDTGDLSAYRVTFDARVAGLAEGVQSTTTVLQVHLDAADDTINVDENTDADALGRFDFQIGRVGLEWQTYTFQLNKAGADAAAKQAFAQYFNKIVGLRTQWQIENATSADWGFDSDNVLYLDNIKIERVYEGLAPLTFASEGTDLVLNWADAATGTTTLQAATNLDGPYTNVTTDGTTYRTPMTGDHRFFRLAWTAPAAP